MKLRYLTIPLLLTALVVLIFVQTASNRIASPARARLHDRHHAIIAEPADHGLQLSFLNAPDGTPYILCEPVRPSGKKGRALRLQLKARNITPSSNRRALLLLHGHGSRKEHHLAIAERFCAAGFTCLIPDLPGHGEHSKETATFGQKEIPDLLALVKHAQKIHELPEKIGVFGLSQGGAVALQLLAHEATPFHSVATVSTFAELSPIIERTARRKSPALAALVPLVQADLKWRHNLSVKEVSPLKAARNIQLPAYIAHGEQDTFIPSQNAHSLLQAFPHENKTLQLVPSAGHKNVLAQGDEIYANLCEFFLKNTKDGMERL